jgi:hypothetical protein
MCFARSKVFIVVVMTVQTFRNAATCYSGEPLQEVQRIVLAVFRIPGSKQICVMNFRHFGSYYILLFQKWRWDSLVGVETRLPNIWLEFRIPVTDFSLLRLVQSGSWAHPAQNLWGILGFSCG